MKILFLNPIAIYRRWPIPFDFSRFIFNQFGTTYPQLAASVPDYTCKFLDGEVENRIDIGNFAKILKDKDVVAISVHSNTVALNAELNIKLIKKIRPEIRIVVGGLHPTIYHKEWLDKGADFVVRGDGEITFKELMDRIRDGGDFQTIEGISYNIDGCKVINPERLLIKDLDDTPLPDWGILDYSLYKNPFREGPIGVVETSRGCVHACSFCLVSKAWNRTQRYKSVERVIEELKILKRSGIHRLFIADDNFGSNLERDTKICRRMIKDNVKIKWSSFARADYIKKNPEFYKLAQQAGLECVMVGFESLNLERLRDMNKGYEDDIINSLKDYEGVYKFLKENKIFTTGLFVIGHPRESIKDLRFTLLNYDRICDFPLFSPFRIEFPMDDLLGVDAQEERKRFFYFDTQVEPQHHRENYLAMNRILTAKSFFRLKNLWKFFSGTYFERMYYHSLYSFLFWQALRFNIEGLKDFIYIIRSRSGYSFDFFEKEIVKRYFEKVLPRYVEIAKKTYQL